MVEIPENEQQHADHSDLTSNLEALFCSWLKSAHPLMKSAVPALQWSNCQAKRIVVYLVALEKHSNR